MEWVDVVDKNNRVIKKVTKKMAHKKGILHRTVISEVRDSKGGWLLIKQASHKQDVGQYVSPVGGHVIAGETEVEALKRETFEELGLKNFKYELIGRAIFNRPVRNHIENHYFIVFEIFSDGEIILNEESDDFIFFKENELKKRVKEKPSEFGAAFYFVVKKFYPQFLK